MPDSLLVSEFLSFTSRIRVVDVRSPGEFNTGHIPGAVNIPLFNDEERAEIGTLYVQTGREQALIRGLDLTLPKTSGFLKAIRTVVPPGAPLCVYCWRGGMRSSSMAALFEQAGYPVFLLKGGYKAYRTFIRSELGKPANIIILGGFTGSGKTEILHYLADSGEQVIDLEALASHKGSAFGAIGLPGQPSNEQFENELFRLWNNLDHHRLIWLEDESRMIGRVILPDPVIRKIQESPLLLLEFPQDYRIRRLVSEYTGIDDQLLIQSVQRIEKRLGKPRTKEAVEQIGQRNYQAVAANLLIYYDKAYAYSVEARPNQPKWRYRSEKPEADLREEAIRIRTFIYETILHESHLSRL